MKPTKTILILVSILTFSSLNQLFSQNYYQQKIGEVQDDTYVITCDEDKLMTDLKILLHAHTELDAVFTSLSIEAGEGYYFLLATDNDNHIKVVRELVLNDGNFHELIPEDTGSSTTITCSGCNIGCDPFKQNGNWICYPNCTAGCIKTVTVVINDDGQ
jgi:hypothetical protein